MLDIVPRLGRPAEVDSDQLKISIENNQCYITWEIAHTLKIPKLIVIGENEKCIFYFMEKTKWTFCPFSPKFKENYKPTDARSLTNFK